MDNDFLLEIGTEEIPAGFLKPGLDKFKNIFTEFLNNKKIVFNEIKTFGTPRRLIVYISNISEKQEDEIFTKTGPSKKAAFDENGNPTKAAIGFAKSQGVEPNDLETVETDKGEYVAIKKVIKGEDTFDILKENLPILIKKLVFPKNMRWGDETISFVRPIHWIVAIFNEKVIPFNYGKLKSSNISYGHRFLSSEPFEVKDFQSFKKTLKEKHVIIDIDERKEKLLTEVREIASHLSGKIEEDEDLIETVTNLVEYPFPVKGTIEDEFLKLPDEVIITPMKVHQKYFPVYNEQDKLLPYFITVSNTKAKDMDIVSKGNERVIKARLNDAKFFYDEDRKYNLEHFVERLRKVVFQKDLGTSYEKMERFRDIAIYLAENLSPEHRELTERAAYLCKGDLETNMVYEFPELQGIMGKYYALHSGEKKEVAEAIYEHYLPKFAGDEIPESNIGSFISIADRIDTIVGFFGIGKTPTGTADPYALRRHAIAIINIILGKKYNFSLKELINRTKNLYIEKFKIDEETVEKIVDFFALRFQNIMNDKFPYDVIESVLSLEFDNIYETYIKLEQMNKIKDDRDFQDIIVPFKRVANITKDWDKTVVNESLFVEPEEKDLYKTFTANKDNFIKYKKDGKYIEALKTFTNLKDDINKFFDNVLVMDKDEKIKINRLNLLKNIYNTFNTIADLTKIQ